MQIDKNVNSSQPVFRAAVAENFKKAARNYFNGVEYRPWRTEIFNKKVEKVVKEFGYDEFTINYKKATRDGVQVHMLFADREGMSVPLTCKDRFRKVIEYFQRMTKGDLYLKIKQYRHDHPELKALKQDIDL